MGKEKGAKSGKGTKVEPLPETTGSGWLPGLVCLGGKGLHDLA